MVAQLPSMKEFQELMPYLPKAKQNEILKHLSAIEKDLGMWRPLPGPQTLAYYSKADILFYGGSAGCGKTDLLLGLAHTQHRKSIIFRREYPQLKGIEDRANELFQKMGDYNRSDKIWRLNNGIIVEFGAVQLERDKEKYQGRAHDLKCLDEITHFSRSQFQFLIGWTRTTVSNQRTRVVCTGNPPTTPEGDWVIDYWAPWLDEKHLNPANPGELRWFTNIDGKDIEVPSGEPFLHDGSLVKPMSRTFVPGKIDDNPYLSDTGYKANLQALPKELRAKLLDGKFTSIREDDAWQVIPSEWVSLAQQRWRERKKPNIPLSCLGVDPARGGNDKTILTPRYANYFAEQIGYPGAQTPDGVYLVSLIVPHVNRNTAINIDVIGIGSSVYDHCYSVLGLNAYPINSAEGSEETDKSGQLTFYNKRAEMWWKLREALDPETGDELAIPDDRELLSDLTSPRWKLTTRGIQVEPKDEIKKRIGRSPDKGDSLVYSFHIADQRFAYATI